MAPLLQTQMNELLASPDPDLVDKIRGAATAHEATVNAGLQVSETERAVLEGLPTGLWYGVRALLVHGLENATAMQVAFDFGSGHQLGVDVAADGSHQINLTAPQPPATAN